MHTLFSNLSGLTTSSSFAECSKNPLTFLNYLLHRWPNHPLVHASIQLIRRPFGVFFSVRHASTLPKQTYSPDHDKTDPSTATPSPYSSIISLAPKNSIKTCRFIALPKSFNRFIVPISPFFQSFSNLCCPFQCLSSGRVPLSLIFPLYCPVTCGHILYHCMCTSSLFFCLSRSDFCASPISLFFCANSHTPSFQPYPADSKTSCVLANQTGFLVICAFLVFSQELVELAASDPSFFTACWSLSSSGGLINTPFDLIPAWKQWAEPFSIMPSPANMAITLFSTYNFSSPPVLLTTFSLSRLNRYLHFRLLTRSRLPYINHDGSQATPFIGSPVSIMFFFIYGIYANHMSYTVNYDQLFHVAGFQRSVWNLFMHKVALPVSNSISFTYFTVTK